MDHSLGVRLARPCCELAFNEKCQVPVAEVDRWTSLVTSFASIAATAIALTVLVSTVGCVHPTRKITKSTTTQTTELLPSVQDHNILTAGDEVIVSWEGPPVLEEQPIVRQVAADGRITIWNEYQVPVAGLTLEQSAEAIRLTFLTNYISRVFRNINVRKVQPGGAASGGQPIRSETNQTSPAAGSRR